MLTAVKGIVKGNTVIIENDNIQEYDGMEVIVTMLDQPNKKTKMHINWDNFIMPSERGKNVDAYMEEMRNNDRI